MANDNLWTMHSCPDDLPWSVYRTLTSAVVPRPIAWVSTTNPDGTDNLAPFSFFTIVSVSPPILAFTPMDPVDGATEQKDTAANVLASKEFVVNLVSEDLARAMNETSRRVKPDIDEFDAAGIDRTESVRVEPPLVADTLIALECTLYDSIRLETSTLLLGEVVYVHVADHALNEDGTLDVANIDAIGRLAGSEYTTLTGRFEMDRPQ